MNRTHIHAATQVSPACNRETLRLGLEKIGLTHDNVLGGQMPLCSSTRVSPEIDLHMTLKVPSHREAESVVRQIDDLMVASNAVGYLHTEYEADAALLDPVWQGWSPCVKFPVSLNPSFSSTEKEWDFHCSVTEEKLPLDLKQYLLGQGMDFLRRRRSNGEVSAIFSVQGRSHPTRADSSTRCS